MTTSVNQPKPPSENGVTTRVVGTIAKEPERLTSRSGNSMAKFPVVVDDGAGTKTWWNCLIMDNLLGKLPEGLIEKHRYAKFIGLGKQRSYDKADGSKGTSNDMLITGVEMQNGDFIQADKKEPGDEG